MVRLVLEDFEETGGVTALIDGAPVDGVESFCTDALIRRFELNLRLPESVGRGPHQLELRLGSRRFAPVTIEVV
jgi:hypothetical protein